jgi:hypothetical protein
VNNEENIERTVYDPLSKTEKSPNRVIQTYMFCRVPITAELNDEGKILFIEANFLGSVKRL